MYRRRLGGTVLKLAARTAAVRLIVAAKEFNLRSDMLARLTILLALFLLILIELKRFDPGKETYVKMQFQSVGGKPVLMLAEQESFSLYTPSGKNCESWTPVYDNRSGVVFGTFEIPAPPKTPPPPPPVVPPGTTPEKSAPAERPMEGLGIFFLSNCVVFDVANPDKETGAKSFPVTLDCNPEAAARIKDDTFAFGAKLNPLKDDGSFPDGVLKAARFECKTWVDIPSAAGPVVHSGKAGFWLKAVEFDGRIAVLWRGAKLEKMIGSDIVGDSISTDGDLSLCFFDGAKFSGEPLPVIGLPRGNTCVWVEKGVLKCLVQTRQKTTETDKPKGRMEIWNIAPDGKATWSETIPPEPNSLGLFSYIAAERFEWENQEYILRSNWQKFELWRHNPGTHKWERVSGGTDGLPVFALERKLYLALAFCLFVVMSGAWLAFLRRRHALTLIRKLRPSDLYAPLAGRMGAYLVDMVAVYALAFGVSIVLFDSPGDFLPFSMLILDFPTPPFFLCFMLYFVLFEWLLGATPGKFLMGLRVVEDGGARPTFWSSLVRNSVGLFERQILLLLLVAAPMVIVSPRRQRLGDLLSRTFVVQKQGLELFIAQRAAAKARGESVETLPGDVPPEREKRDKK